MWIVWNMQICAPKSRFLGYFICQLEFWFLEGGNFFDKPQMVCRGKNIWDLARRLMIIQKLSNSNTAIIMRNCVKYADMWPKVLISGILYMSKRVVISSELKLILTSLRLFVKEKYLRSHKAPRDYPKTLKFRITQYIIIKCPKTITYTA